MEKRRIEKGAVDDLVLLDDISENGVVSNLRARYEKDLIYSYIGPVLISVNPFKEIRGLYKRELMQRYFGQHKFELAPHVYASAEEAFRHLMTTGKNQCVLISGESGAGKTEAAKKFLEYITVVSQDRAEANDKLSVREIKDALLQSNPVLEAFGNAKTLRNDNSSRFGKFLNMQFDYGGTPLGGTISTYLLEKPRVVSQTPGERSFHVFYQLCAGSSDRELGLSRPEDFEYIKGTTKVRDMDDRSAFNEMSSAMEKVGIRGSDKKNIFRLVAAILHLGNIRFESKRGGDKCEVSRDSSAAVRMTADLLEVSERDLCKALTHRTIQSRIETVTSPLTSVDECTKTRDALAKALYSRCFLRIVDIINTTIHTDMVELSLGVLDIYGFEIFEHNSFEQLCINFTNEKLQQLFIELTLKAEQDEYKREGITWTPVPFFNNKIVCDLIEATRPAGIFAYLDEESIYPQGTDRTYLKKMETNLASHKHYGSLATKTNHTPDSFMIKHYAGDVVYSVDGMLDKNKDTLFRDLIDLVGCQSKSQFYNSLFPEGKQGHDGKKPITAGKAYVRDMQLLIADLEKCEPHYIRTIKPNGDKRSGMYDLQLVQHQVRYLGLVENVRVRRAGYAFRSEFGYFVRRYKMLSSATWPRASGRDTNDTERILRDLGINDFEMGKTKVFIREPKSVFRLEDAREKRLHEIVRIIQVAYRKFKARLYFLRLREESAQLLHQKKRRRGSWVLYFIGDYLHAQENPGITSQIDGRIRFADRMNMFKSNKMVEVIFVMTSSSLFIFDPVQLKPLNVVPFMTILSFGLSTFADGFMILDNHTEKPQPSIILESVRKAEIATVLKEEYEKHARRDLNLVFADQYTVRVEKKNLFGKKIIPKTLVFVENQMMRGPTTYLALKKQDNPDFKTTIRIDVSPDLGSRAPYQLDSPLPDRLNRHHGRPQGERKKIVYGGYRKQSSAVGGRR